MLLTVLVTAFNRDCRIGLRRSAELRNSSRALACAKAGLDVAIVAVRAGDDVRTNIVLSELLSGEITFSLGQGRCKLAVTQESSKLNVNYLSAADGVINRARVDQLLGLIDLLNKDRNSGTGIGYDIAASIIDWVDSDEKTTQLEFVRRGGRGAESVYYRRGEFPYRCANSPFDTNAELLLVKGITPQVFRKTGDYVTVYGMGKVNINCASKEVIESLSVKMDPSLAQMIVSRRDVKPFDSVFELRDFPGMTDSVYNQIKRFATVRSAQPYYSVTSTGTAGDVRCELTAIIKANSEFETADVIFCRESYGRFPGIVESY